MPLLNYKPYEPPVPVLSTQSKNSAYCIKFTGQSFNSKDDYDEAMRFYDAEQWMCRSTGSLNMTYKDALDSEIQAKQELQNKFPTVFEEPVLRIVHHATMTLDSLVDESSDLIHSEFFVGDRVEFLTKPGFFGTVIERVTAPVKASTSSEPVESNSQQSPTSSVSDKENSDAGKALSSPKKSKIELKPYAYNVKLDKPFNVGLTLNTVQAIPAKDLKRTGSSLPVPSKRLLKLFIRTNALRMQPTNPKSPWVVDATLTKKYNIPNKLHSLFVNNATSSPQKSPKTPSAAQNHSSKVNINSSGGQKLKSSAAKRPSSGPSSGASSTKQSKKSLIPSASSSKGSNGQAIKKAVKPTKPSSENALPAIEVCTSESSTDEEDNCPLSVTANALKSPSPLKSQSTPQKSSLGGTPKTGSSPRPSQLGGAVPTIDISGDEDSEGDDVRYVLTKPVSSSAKKAGAVSPLNNSNRVKKKKRLSQEGGELDLAEIVAAVAGGGNSQKTSPNRKKATTTVGQKQPVEVGTDSSSDSDEDGMTLYQVATKLKNSPPKQKVLKQASLFDFAKKKSPSKKTQKSLSTPPKLSPVVKLTPLKLSSKKKAALASSKSTGPPKLKPVVSPGGTTTQKAKNNSQTATKPKSATVEKTKSPVKPPLTPQQLLTRKLNSVAAQLLRHSKDTGNAAKLAYSNLAKATIKQYNMEDLNLINCSSVREDLKQRAVKLLEEEKLAKMTEDERKEYMKQKREEERKKRAERFEDKELPDLKPIPRPKPVAAPNRFPNELFGYAAMVTEFLAAYKGVLSVEGQSPLTTTETFLQAVTSGEEGFKPLTAILVSLLQCLLQDRIAEDYKELGVKMSELPITSTTAFELSRLVLRVQNDDSDDNSSTNSEDKELNIPEVDDDVLMQLESAEFTSLPVDVKLKVFDGIIQRVLGSYSVSEFLEKLQQAHSKCWKEKMSMLKERAEKDKATKEHEKENKKSNGDSHQSATALSQEKAKSIGIVAFYGKKAEASPFTPKADSKSDAATPAGATPETDPTSILNVDEPNDLASIVKRRRITMAQERAKKEEQDKLEKERRLKEDAELAEKLRCESIEKRCDEAHFALKAAERVLPLGMDRNRSRYWLLNSKTTPGLFVEEVVEEEDADLSAVTGEPSTSNNFGKFSVKSDSKNRWFVYDSIEDIEALSVALHPKAVRESQLATEIRRRLPEIKQNIAMLKKAREKAEKMHAETTAYEEHAAVDVSAEETKEEAVNSKDEAAVVKVVKKKDQDEEQESVLSQSFRTELLDLDHRISSGGLGVLMEDDDFQVWVAKVNTATSTTELGAALIECQKRILPQFLRGMMALSASEKPPPNFLKQATGKEDADQESEEIKEKVNFFKQAWENKRQAEQASEVEKRDARIKRWVEATQNCTTLSRLHVLLNILDVCIKWDKSIAKARCRICRRKENDEDLLLCDWCNQPYHMYCLRPRLNTVPKGQWLCIACRPSPVRSSSRTKNYKEATSSDEETETESDQSEKEIVHDEVCATCAQTETDAEGELVLCSTCPAAFHIACHNPPMRHAPRGAFACQLCKDGGGKRSTLAKNKNQQRHGKTSLDRWLKASSTTIESTSSSNKNKSASASSKASKSSSKSVRRSLYGATKTADSDAENEEDKEESTRPSSRPLRGSRRSRDDSSYCRDSPVEVRRSSRNVNKHRRVVIDETEDEEATDSSSTDLQTKQKRLSSARKSQTNADEIFHGRVATRTQEAQDEHLLTTLEDMLKRITSSRLATSIMSLPSDNIGVKRRACDLNSIKERLPKYLNLDEFLADLDSVIAYGKEFFKSNTRKLETLDELDALVASFKEV